MKLKNNVKGNRYFKYEHAFGSNFFLNVVVSEMYDQLKTELKWELGGPIVPLKQQSARQSRGTEARA